MDKENLTPNEELETTEEITEVVEDVVEEIKEAAEDVTDAAIEEVEEFAEEVAEDSEDLLSSMREQFSEEYPEVAEEIEEIAEDVKKKTSGGAIAAIVALIVVIIALGALLFTSLFVNKYNNAGFLNTSGTTIGDYCAEYGYNFDELKEAWSLPADMPESTYMNAAISFMPIKTYAALYYTDFATVKEAYQLPETIPERPLTIWEKIKAIFVKEQVPVTEDTTWGDIMDNTTLGLLFPDFEVIKEHYELGDDVTTDMLFGEVREEIEKKDIAFRKEQEKLAAENEVEGENPETEATEGEDAVVETEGETESAPEAESTATEEAQIVTEEAPEEENVGENPELDKSGN